MGWDPGDSGTRAEGRDRVAGRDDAPDRPAPPGDTFGNGNSRWGASSLTVDALRSTGPPILHRPQPHRDPASAGTLTRAPPRNLVVQEPVSRAESIRTRLSRAAWQTGLDTYFTHSVPFAEGTGLELASRLAQVLEFLAAGRTSGLLPVLEVGAGMGMLSKHLLDLLRTREPDLYDRVVVHVTDASERMLAQVRAAGVLREHGARVRYAPFDLARSPRLTYSPVLIYQAFVLDSLPVRHIEVTDGQIRELLVRTSVPASATVTDTTVFPPAVLNAEEIAALLRSGDGPRLGTLSRDLVPLLVEEFVPVSLGGDGPAVSEAERREIEMLVARTGRRSSVRFNHSRTATAGLRRLATDAAPEACVVVHDFGYELPNGVAPSDLTVSYGGTSCHPLCWDHLQASVGAAVAASLGRNARDGESHTRIWYRGARASAFAARRNDLTKGRDRGGVDRAIRSITNWEGPADQFARVVRDVHGTLSELEGRNYTLALVTAWEFLKRGQVQSAIAWAHRSQADYGPVATDSHLLLAICHRWRGNLVAAERAVTRALAISPGYAEARAEQAAILRRRGRWAEAAAAGEQAIPGLRGDAMWGLVASVITDRLFSGHTISGLRALRSVAHAAGTHPGAVPRFVLNQLGQAVRLLQKRTSVPAGNQ